MITKCVFPAAGLGTRFLPVTKSIPKEMLPIVSRPIIEYGVQEALDAKINHMVIVTNEKKQSIKDFFTENKEFDGFVLKSNKHKNLETLKDIISKSSFSYINQNKMLGLGHAISLTQELVKKESFAVILPDDVCHNKSKNVIEQLTEIHNNFPDKCIVAIEEVPDNEISKYGIVEIGKEIDENIFSIRSMVEKPELAAAPSNLAIIGRYILTPDIFKAISNLSADRNGEIQITHALNTLAKFDKVIGYKYQGKRLDCGYPDGFLEANIFFRNLDKYS